jgi:hypothetical protein
MRKMGTSFSGIAKRPVIDYEFEEIQKIER